MFVESLLKMLEGGTAAMSLEVRHAGLDNHRAEPFFDVAHRFRDLADSFAEGEHVPVSLSQTVDSLYGRQGIRRLKLRG